MRPVRHLMLVVPLAGASLVFGAVDASQAAVGPGATTHTTATLIRPAGPYTNGYREGFNLGYADGRASCRRRTHSRPRSRSVAAFRSGFIAGYDSGFNRGCRRRH